MGVSNEEKEQNRCDEEGDSAQKIMPPLQDAIALPDLVIFVTDDLAMGAMVRQYSFDDILLRTILAGADMLCLSNNGGTYDPDLVPHAVDAIFQMVKEGKISAARITQSANKIRNLKKEL